MKVYAHSFQISNALPLRTSVKRRNSKTNTTLFVRRWSCAPFLVLRVSRNSPLGFLHLITFDRSTTFSLPPFSFIFSYRSVAVVVLSFSSRFPLVFLSQHRDNRATLLTSRSNQENCASLGEAWAKLSSNDTKNTIIKILYVELVPSICETLNEPMARNAICR